LTLDLEGRPAAARASHVRIAELEARAVGPLDVVDFCPIQVLVAQGIDEELHAVRLVAFVHLRGLIFEIEVVLKARAATSNDPQAQALAFEALGRRDFTNLVSGEGSNGNHRTDRASTWPGKFSRRRGSIGASTP